MRIDVTFSESGERVLADFGEVQIVKEYVGGEVYTGDYSVVPKVDAQTIPTRGKIMIDDMEVTAIPIYEASNNSGGTTIFIAKEV